MTTSGARSARAVATPSAVSARTWLTRMPARRSCRMISRASSSLSSTTSTCLSPIASRPAGEAGGGLVHQQPVDAEHVHGPHELLEHHRLADETVRTEPVTGHYVALLVGGGEHDDREGPRTV